MTIELMENEEQKLEGQLTLDVFHTEDEIVIKSAIAGVSPEDLDISITKDTVNIKGVRQKDENIENGNYYYRELHYGPFSRSVILPEDIDTENASANLKNGILTIRLPKIRKVKKLKVA